MVQHKPWMNEVHLTGVVIFLTVSTTNLFFGFQEQGQVYRKGTLRISGGKMKNTNPTSVFFCYPFQTCISFKGEDEGISFGRLGNHKP